MGDSRSHIKCKLTLSVGGSNPCGFLVMLMGTIKNDVIQKIEKTMNNIHSTAKKRTIYPSPKLTLTLTSHLGQNVGLGEG